MRVVWAVLALLLLGGGLAWWFGHPARHVTKAAQAQGEPRPSLYRWHDADGVLHITDRPPPAGTAYERIPLDRDSAR
ncbi:DUF4124 domain-containing protein [Pseudoxanthomonas winnipegensis]|uniref:DUF4124 domain-containing protein n=1 Tax=Pseudoxanthomonas winnipegensis TaxID=2480810 RepID=A0A4Q8LPI7_9GAMM|nr:DUF4124 domain-containing protein [Pseudoxanthomonas winnipegensis]TAA33117.1 DUF4124 domain-containing protein [Pseudoxanthomonas winnipegensis]TAA44309.1 DUF4124 domain-containing protein [Pseudoxanthomonas winnipegensis]TBV76765.1 DUF4124 domain-containing protein [Pseudoxanthomonas winnipegensis]TBV78398.1 DUF4124 domain-containing protein [Pseudoxanthomonas winnipegensis]